MVPETSSSPRSPDQCFAESEEQLAASHCDLPPLHVIGAAFSAAANAILITDRDGQVLWANDALCRLCGYSIEELRSGTPRILKSGRHGEVFYRQMWSTILAGKVWTGEVVDRHKAGHYFVAQQTISPVKDNGGQVTHFISIYEDVTMRKESESRIQHLAYHDSLTDLPNRLQFQNRLPQAMAQAQRNRRMLALHFIDLDAFKAVNDTLGHRVGDLILREIGQRLRGCVRSGDLVARFGGDEFAILQADLNRVDGAAVLARKIIEVVSEPIAADNQEVRITPSIGITVYPLDESQPDQLLQNADLAMYQAKKAGRGTYHFFTPALSEEIRQRLAIERELLQGLERNEFHLDYQPIFDLATRSLAGIEALLRWRHPQKGRLLPGQFLSVVEESGQIEALTRWVLDQVAKQVADWRAEGLTFPRLAVNISPANFVRGGVAAAVDNLRVGDQLDWLELDISESNLLGERGVIETIQKLHDRGVTFAIEDFGTGYSSLQYLRRLRVHRLKIASTFIRRLPIDRDSAAIVHAIIDLGHRLELKVCAVGVESAEQVEFLNDRGCDQVQGFLFQTPLPSDEVSGWLRSGIWDR